MSIESLQEVSLGQVKNSDFEFSKETLVIAKQQQEWRIESPISDNEASLSLTNVNINASPNRETLSRSLSIFHNLLGDFPYATFTLKDNSASGGSDIDNNAVYLQVHLSRPQSDPTAIAVDIVPAAQKGARYSDISSRIFGKTQNGELVANQESIGEHFTEELARDMLRLALRCEVAVNKFRAGDVFVHNNPQGVQEYVNQPLAGFPDTGGQNKYTECFSRALGSLVPRGKDEPTSQLIINRAGPSQSEIEEQNRKSGSKPKASDVELEYSRIVEKEAARRGLHYFPDENICLAFVEDRQPNKFLHKEASHPVWQVVEDPTTLTKQDDYVRVSGGKLARYGIEDGFYKIVNHGPMKELADSSKSLTDYFKLSSLENNRKVVLLNHYVDAAYYAEFLSKATDRRYESYFIMHSLGTFKADGLSYPEKLMSETGQAHLLETDLRFTDRILGELWITQKCHQSLIANSDTIAHHAHQYLNTRHVPETMIAVDDAANGHIAREQRGQLALKTFTELHKMYLNSCDNTTLGPPVPEERRLTLEQLINAQIIFERSRHAEADSKGKWAVVKAMAIAQSDPRAQAAEAPDRVLVVNVNLDALHKDDLKLKHEVEQIIADIQSIRNNGGHVVVKNQFDYHFGLDLCQATDCYVALPAFEPFGMGVLEAAANGAPVIARSDVPSVREVLSNNVNTIKFPLRNSEVKLGIADGAILVGGKPQESEENSARFTEYAYNGAAAAINAITLGVNPVNSTLRFDAEQMSANASQLVRDSHYNWTHVAQRFYEQVYNGVH
jgi:Glycosyl transferases group 1